MDSERPSLDVSKAVQISDEDTRAGSDLGEPVPDQVFEAARAAFGQRRPESALLELTFDSLDEVDAVPTGARPKLRTLALRAGSITLDLTIIERGGRCILEGHVEPVPRSVHVGAPGRTLIEADSEPDGGFRVDDVPHGPASITLEFGEPAPQRTAHTDWINF